MSWFRDIKEYSHSKVGTLVSIRIKGSSKKKEVQEVTYKFNDRIIGDTYLGAASISAGTLANEMYRLFANNDDYMSNLLKGAAIALDTSTWWSSSLVTMNSEGELDAIIPEECDDLVITIPVVDYNFKVSKSYQQKDDWRSSFIIPMGLITAEDPSKDAEGNYYLGLQADGFGGFHYPDTGIIGIRSLGQGGREAAKATNLHEFLHASYNVADTLKEMYGDTPEIQLEETIVHFVTDHLDKLAYIRDKSLAAVEHYIPVEPPVKLNLKTTDKKTAEDRSCSYLIEDLIIVTKTNETEWGVPGDIKITASDSTYKDVYYYDKQTESWCNKLDDKLASSMPGVKESKFQLYKSVFRDWTKIGSDDRSLNEAAENMRQFRQKFKRFVETETKKEKQKARNRASSARTGQWRNACEKQISHEAMPQPLAATCAHKYNK